MRILVIGRNGQVATELLRAHWPAEYSVTALGRSACDLTDPVAVAAALDRLQPGIVINSAAYTAVDRAEAEEAAAYALNAAAVGVLGAECQARGIAVLHLSTDYVFDGRSDRPWRETDPTGPLSAYGRTKLAGERLLAAATDRYVIVRTSWVYAAHGQNFVRTMLRLGAERDQLRIVADQVGCPTSAADLARVLVAATRAIIAGTMPFGLYHYAGAGAVSWYDFAGAIFAEAEPWLGRRPSLVPIASADYAAPAPRPASSVLDHRLIARTLGIAATPWPDALRAVLAEVRADAVG